LCTGKSEKETLKISFEDQDGVDFTGLRSQAGSTFLVKFQQELPTLLKLYEAYDIDGQEEEDDKDLNFSKLHDRLFGFRLWCALMLLMEEFAEQFILKLTRTLRMTHPVYARSAICRLTS
jgi:hypothetical protein